MGAKRKGRPRVAPEVLEATGAYRTHPERKNHEAPKANGEEPKMPDYFNDDEKSKWNELVKDMREMRILSSETRELLIAYCTAYGGWMEARRMVKKTGIVLVRKDADGTTQVKRNPFSVELHKYREEMNKLLPEFGLTPSARSRLVSMTVHDEDDPFQSILSRLSGTN